MTVDNAISRFDDLCPNSLEYSEKLRMLSELDGRIFTEIISLYSDLPETFYGYDPGTPGNTVLLVRYPYDGIYTKYLAAMTDEINGDTSRFANSRLSFNNAYEEFAAYYNRTHRIKHSGRINSAGDIL